MEKHNSRIFLIILPLSAGILSFVSSYFLFRQEASVVSVFLVALSLYGMINRLFESNRREIWDKVLPPLQANIKLGISLLLVFLGIMFSYSIVAILLKPNLAAVLLDKQIGLYKDLSPETGLAGINFGTFSSLFRHNIIVLLVVFFFPLLYRTGGLLLIIAWNASTWGTVFGYFARCMFELYGVKKGIITFLMAYTSVFPHILTESSGYILSAMAGFFVSKAVVKYFKDFEKLARVLNASFLILLVSIIFIALSAYIESNITPKIINYVNALLNP